MDQSRFRQLEQFFARAVVAPAGERHRIVTEASALDAEVGRELALMLAVEPQSALLGALVEDTGASLLANGAPADGPSPASARCGADLAEASQPSSSPAAELLAQLTARAPRESRYRIDGEVARGGMGAILRAFDPDLRRVLAMKVALEPSAPAAGERQRERVGRFLEEAQITAQLDHPGIVPVHEIGLDAGGRLYFTMRLVGGRDLGAIYELARTGAEGWSTTRVLGVLLRVCEAMAYAHSKGVIHRDLKPANVMVGRFGEVYVMDWGLAKVLGNEDSRHLDMRPLTGIAALQSVRNEERAADPTTPLVTTDGTVLGTPAYMSPEQAAGDVAAMDVRSDIYALGAMLYHLFAGHAPYHEDGETRSPRRLWQTIARDPPKPLAALAPATPRDLVAIVERAMARSMAERYPSVAALAEDLRAYVEGRVVGAYETGSWAELRKWVGRNKALSASLAAAVLAVAIGAIGFAIKADQATRAAAVASSARAEAEASALVARRNEAAAKQREAEANASKRRAEKVTELVQNALTGADPNQGGARNFLVTEAMDRAIAEIEGGALKDDPETEASLQVTIAWILLGNSRAEDAVRLAQGALATRQRLFSGPHPAVADGLGCLARGLHAQGKFDEALAEHEAAFAMRQQLFHGDHPDIATSLEGIGACLLSLSQPEVALQQIQAALEMNRRLFPGDNLAVASSLNSLAGGLRAVGRSAEALPMFQAALEMYRRLFKADHPELARTLSNTALCLQHLGKNDAALPLLQDALEMRQRLFPEDHPDVAKSLGSVGHCLMTLNRSPEALPKCEASLEMIRRLFSGDHPELATSLTVIALCLCDLGNHAEALPHFRAALEMRQRLFPMDHYVVAMSLGDVGACLLSLRRSAEALQRFQESLAMSRRLYADHAHPYLATSLNNLGHCLHVLERDVEALPHLQAALEIRERLFAGHHSFVAQSLSNLADCLHSLGRSAEALPYAERANDMAAETLVAEHPWRKRFSDTLQQIRSALSHSR